MRCRPLAFPLKNACHFSGGAVAKTSERSAEVPSSVSFADVAHQTIIFDTSDEASRLILALLDTPWVQRLRRIRQTGYTNLVYMFSEHSRFGHSLGVAYLANRLMKNLAKWNPSLVRPYQNAVAAAALLHDVGHVAPGSHLGERVWGLSHESVSRRIIGEDPEIRRVLEGFDPSLPRLVQSILAEDGTVPSWTKAIISGGGWNADRGNWAIVDSAMCSVSYGRYNVFALIDAFRLTDDGELVLQESRMDALTHFFVARDSMYRQVYQHRVLQATDALVEKIILRLRDLVDGKSPREELPRLQISADRTLFEALTSAPDSQELPLGNIFSMTEGWWDYHLERWCSCRDGILRDLALRLRDRHLFKTVRADSREARPGLEFDDDLIRRTQSAAERLGFSPRYYVVLVHNADMHRGRSEEPPRVLLDNGEITTAAEVEPLIDMLLKKPEKSRVWLAVPKEVKDAVGRAR